MAKKSGGNKSAGKSKPPSADHHRQQAQKHSAQARIHSAKADLMDAQNPPKRRGTMFGPY